MLMVGILRMSKRFIFAQGCKGRNVNIGTRTRIVMYEYALIVLILVISWYLFLGQQCAEAEPDLWTGEEEDDPYVDWDSVPGSGHVVKLTGERLSRFLQPQASALVMYYAPWCSHCHALMPAFALAAGTLARDRAVTAVFAAVNCEAYPQVRTRHHVYSYPTLNYYRHGRRIGEYNFRLRARDLVQFMQNPPINSAALRNYEADD